MRAVISRPPDVDNDATLIRLSRRRDIHVAYTGLHGEKVSKDRFPMDRARRASFNPQDNVVGLPILDVEKVRSVEMGSNEAAAAWMSQPAAPPVKSGV